MILEHRRLILFLAHTAGIVVQALLGLYGVCYYVVVCDHTMLEGDTQSEKLDSSRDAQRLISRDLEWDLNTRLVISQQLPLNSATHLNIMK